MFPQLSNQFGLFVYNQSLFDDYKQRFIKGIFLLKSGLKFLTSFKIKASGHKGQGKK